MPKRIELPEGGCVEIAGVPIVPVFARGRRLVLAVGGYDADGLLEGPDDVKRTAARWRGGEVDSADAAGID